MFTSSSSSSLLFQRSVQSHSSLARFGDGHLDLRRDANKEARPSAPLEPDKAKDRQGE